MGSSRAVVNGAPRLTALGSRPTHDAVPGAESPWVVFSLDLPEDAADAVASFLLDDGAQSVVTGVVETGSGETTQRGRTCLEACVPRADAPRLQAALTRFLDDVATLVPAWGAVRVDWRDLENAAWEATFRAHHRPLLVGKRLLVAPPWAIPARDDRLVLVVDPGMAFGTGQHATTRSCLEEIESLVEQGAVGSALDVGTGSGILATALARLGVGHVVALDVDSAVLEVARATFVRNEVPWIRLLGGTASAIRGTFDLVVANLLADTLTVEAPVLADRVAPAGTLVLSGILDRQARHVAAAYPGWVVTAVREDGPWHTLRLQRRP